MPSRASGFTRCTACASTCAAEWRRIDSPSGEPIDTGSTAASSGSGRSRSQSTPSTRAAITSRSSLKSVRPVLGPGPGSSRTEASATLTGAPSGLSGRVQRIGGATASDPVEHHALLLRERREIERDDHLLPQRPFLGVEVGRRRRRRLDPAQRPVDLARQVVPGGRPGGVHEGHDRVLVALRRSEAAGDLPGRPRSSPEVPPIDGPVVVLMPAAAQPPRRDPRVVPHPLGRPLVLESERAELRLDLIPGPSPVEVRAAAEHVDEDLVLHGEAHRVLGEQEALRDLVLQLLLLPAPPAIGPGTALHLLPLPLRAGGRARSRHLDPATVPRRGCPPPGAPRPPRFARVPGAT